MSNFMPTRDNMAMWIICESIGRDSSLVDKMQKIQTVHIRLNLKSVVLSLIFQDLQSGSKKHWIKWLQKKHNRYWMRSMIRCLTKSTTFRSDLKNRKTSFFSTIGRRMS